MVVVLVLLAPRVVFADYISDAAQALQSASVYVAPGTERTDNDTAGKLQTRLKKDDKIVLVMLPAAAETEIGDISTIAFRLSEELGNQQIIGLSVGDKVVGYSPILPVGVASDQMRRAESVSNDPVTALSTFAQNIHVWQAAHPEPIPPPNELPEEKEGSSWLVWVGIGLGVAAFLIVGLFASGAVMVNGNASKERTSFKAPDQVKDLLEKIARKLVQVRDKELTRCLYDMCVDIETYFTKSEDKKKDALFYQERLPDVVQVLEKYIDVLKNPRYYDNPEEILQSGKEALQEFAKFVLRSIRHGNAAELFEFEVNRNILEAQAQRYR